MRLSAILGKSLYFDGERYFLVPEEEPHATRGNEAWTVAGEERRLTPEQRARFEVTEPEADAFIALEIDAVLDRTLPLVAELFFRLTTPPDPTEVQALMAGVADTLGAVTRGDTAAIGRFKERAARVADTLDARGRKEMAQLVRELPDNLTTLLQRP